MPRSGRAEAPSELRASRRYVKGEKQGLGPTVRKAPFASSGQTRVHPQNQPNCRSLAGLGITATTNGAHRQECLCHGCRLEGGATKAPGSRDLLSMMALSRRAAGHPGLQGQRPTLRDFFFGASSACAEGREGWGTRKHERRTAPLKPKGAAPIESEATADPSLRS